MRNKKLWIIIGVVAIVTAVFAFMPRHAPVDDKPVVRIAALYPMTGDAALFGEASRKVVESFMKEWEANNPDARYRYEVRFEDVQMSTQKAITAVQRMAARNRADAVIGLLSAQALAVNPIVNRNQIISLFYTLDPATSAGDYVFRLATDVELAIDKLILRLQKQGIKKIALVAVNDVSNNILYDEIVRQIGAQDKITLGPVFRINPGERDFIMIIQRIKQSDADMLVLQALPPEADVFFAAIRNSGLEIPVSAYQTLGMLADKSLAEGMWEISDVTASPEWIEKHSEILGGTNTYYSEATYTMLNILINAWENADAEPGQKPTPESVAQSIKSHTAGLETPLGILQTDDNGDILMNVTVREIRDGMPVMIKE